MKIIFFILLKRLPYLFVSSKFQNKKVNAFYFQVA